MSQPRAIATSHRPTSFFSSWSMIGWIICVILLVTDQWILGPALFVLLLAAHLLTRDDGPPVVLAAFSYQWLQVTAGLIYLALTGRQIVEMRISHYQPMVWIGLASICVYFGGYWIVTRKTVRVRRPTIVTSERASLGLVALTYAMAIGVSLVIQRFAWSLPMLTQLLFMLGFARYALLYVLVTRLCRPHPRWALIVLVTLMEIGIGFSGYFASFRESLVFIAIAIIVASRQRKAMVWLAAGAMGIVAFYSAVTWTAIKPLIRKQYSYSASTGERISRAVSAIGPALAKPGITMGTQVDYLVSRMWQVYYPALALERVPAVIPHTNGEILRGAVSNTLMPRAFFPAKGVLPSESDKVRKYAGAFVAGRSSGTSFAFGYAAESYVDFGWPLMLVPIFLFGCLIGYADRLLKSILTNDNLLQGVRVVFLWSSMYLFETSWVIMIGTMVSLLIVLVSVGTGFERALGLAVNREKRFAIKLGRKASPDSAPGGALRGGDRIRTG